MHGPAIMTWWQTISSLLFFERCRACCRNLQSDETGMAMGLQAVCHICWKQMQGQTPSLQWCRLDEGPSFAIASATYYKAPLKKLIYRLKYDGDRLLVSDLSVLLKMAWFRLLPVIHSNAQAAQESPANLIIVPIPLHPHRQRKRGFNHALLLATQMAECLDVKVEPRAMRRVKNTMAQHGLKRIERMQNLSGAFECDKTLVNGKIIVLVDDIYTSGATLAEAARTLAAAGAPLVAGLTVARAV